MANKITNNATIRAAGKAGKKGAGKQLEVSAKVEAKGYKTEK